MNHGKDISQGVQTLILAFVSGKRSGFLTGITCTETGKHEGWRAGIVVCMGTEAQRSEGKSVPKFVTCTISSGSVCLCRARLGRERGQVRCEQGSGKTG